MIKLNHNEYLNLQQIIILDKQGLPVNITGGQLSSIYNNTMNWDEAKTSNGIIHTKKIGHPWINLKFNPIEISQIKIHNRQDCCWHRLGGFEVLVQHSIDNRWNKIGDFNHPSKAWKNIPVNI